jgi:hypothetical protein
MHAENRKASSAAAKIASLDIIYCKLVVYQSSGPNLLSIAPVKLAKVGTAPAKAIETAGMLGTYVTDLV